MTKKFVISVSENGKDEFVIPNIFENEDCFVGIETGKRYKEGLICYTGVDLTTAKVLDRIIENRSLNIFQRRTMRKALDEYFIQIKSFKIRNKVKLVSKSKLKLVKK